MEKRDILGALKTLNLGLDLRAYSDSIWTAFEHLVAVSFAIRQKDARDIFCRFGTEDDWPMYMVKRISKDPELKDPSRLLPEKNMTLSYNPGALFGFFTTGVKRRSSVATEHTPEASVRNGHLKVMVSLCWRGMVTDRHARRFSRRLSTFVDAGLVVIHLGAAVEG